ncbi:uncharacterized protein LOC103496610 isoform X2 [Cucumis melo]|uniref:Uncharacterized protein LOC103496610 isoform X2 n=1 Tax=Cucumis melo TaxID=3656 RepID=A0A1S4E178_CUCME|nr:uncharacterized protein LOC103496610 isoform X2 [Cucumis melo]
MQTQNYDQISQKSSQITKHEDRFFTRALSKELNSTTNSSFRVYYGGATGAIPFRWESRPGTPKHTFSDTSIPPLTPPPSYFSSSHSTSKASSKPTLLSSIFPRLTPRKSRTFPSFSSSSGSSSSSSSLASWSSSFSSSSSSPSPFVRPKFFKRRRHFSDIPSLPFEYTFDDKDGDEVVAGSTAPNSPTSILCFGGGSSGRASLFGGCYQLVSVKKALLSIVGHGSASRALPWVYMNGLSHGISCTNLKNRVR